MTTSTLITPVVQSNGQRAIRRTSVAGPSHSHTMPTREAALPRRVAPGTHARALLAAINHILAASYAEQRHVSQLLTTGGLTGDEIALLRQTQLGSYTQRLAERLHTWLIAVLKPRTADIMVRRSGLDGGPPQTLYQIGMAYRMSRERVRQIEEQAHKRLSDRRRRAELEYLVVNLARRMLGDLALPNSLSVPEILHIPGASAQYTIELFQHGYTPDAIAARRGLVLSTIYNHLALAIRAGRLAGEQVIDNATLALVQCAMETEPKPNNRVELHSRLPELITFGHLECVLAMCPGLLPGQAPLRSEQHAQLYNAVLALVQEHPEQYTSRVVARILNGSQATQLAHLRNHSAFGSLAELDQASINDAIQGMLRAGALHLGHHRRLVAPIAAHATAKDQ